MGALLNSFLSNQAPLSGGPGASPSTGGGPLLQSFLSNAKTIPAPTASPVTKVSSPAPQPAAQPNFMQQIGSAAQGAVNSIKGFFTPQGGKTQPIKAPEEAKIPTPTFTKEQIASIAELKPGQKIPGFTALDTKEAGVSASMKTKKPAKPPGNVIDELFNNPAESFLNNTGIIGDSIKKFATDLYKNPVETIVPQVKTAEKFAGPAVTEKMKQGAPYKIETQALQGVIQGALRIYANWNPKVENFLNKEVKSVGTKGDAEIAGNTIGNIVGTIGSFVLGGELTQALKFGKVALPATFAALGQTSLPASTPVEARLRNLVIDTVSGTLLEYIKPLENLSKLSFAGKTVEYTKQLSQSMAVLSSQVYLDARSVGASNDQALEMVKSSALLLLGLHGAMIARNAGGYALRSEFKAGSAEFTPDQARAVVVGSNLENTGMGKQIIKAAYEADAQGKNLKIDLTAAKESKVAGVVKKFTNLQTPNGIKMTNLELIDPTGAVEKLGGPEASPTEPQTPGIPEGVQGIDQGKVEIAKYNGEQPPIPEIKTPTEFKTPVEERAFTQITKSPAKIIEEYKHAFHNEVSPDLARALFQDYQGHNAGELNRAVGTVKDIVYDNLLKTQQGAKNNTVLITAGGSGSGKTTSIAAQSKNENAIVLDTTFSNNSAIKDVRKAIDHGFNVHMTFVYRDPVEAWTDGALKRIADEGRVVPEQSLLYTHMEAQKNILKAYSKYKDNPKVEFTVIHNRSGQPPEEVSIDKVKEHLYNREELAKAISAATEKAYEQGKITKQQYEAAIQGREAVGSSTTQKSTVQPGEKVSSEKVKGDISAEAKKYSSLKEFIDSRSFLYHGTNTENATSIEKNGFKPFSDESGISLTDDKNIAKEFAMSRSETNGGHPVILKVDVTNLNPKTYFDNPETLGNKDREYTILGKDINELKTEKQLENIYKEAHGDKPITSKTDHKQLGFEPKNLENPMSDKATQEVDKIVKQSEIAKALSEKLGVPIRRGKFRRGGAIGVYKHDPKVIRVKAGGLQTVFHEVAHYLDDTIGFSKDIKLEEQRQLVQEYGRDLEGDPEVRQKEAFAEYLRFKMTGQNEKISMWAPEFDKAFTETIAGMPNVQSVIDTATADFKRWNDQPAVSKILSHLSIGEQRKGSLKDRFIQKTHAIYTAALDDLHPLADFSGIAKKNLGKVTAEEDPYILARNLRGWVGKAELFLKQGTFGKDYWITDENGKTHIDFKGKSYSEIMKPIEKAKKLDEFRVYIVAQRIVNDLVDRNIKTGISVQDAKDALAELNEKHPEFEEVARERREYKDQLLKYAQESGLIGEEALKNIKELNKFHVPFYRVMEEAQAGFLGKTKIGGNIANPIKKIKGSEREIIDPLESDVKDTYAIINAAERNAIGIAMANIAKQNYELGRLFEEVAKPMKAMSVNVKEVMDKATKGTDSEGIDIPKEIADMVVTLFRSTYASGPNMMNVNIGDKQLVFEVDPDLFKALQGLNVEDIGAIMRILSMPAKVLRAGATLSPDFSVRNPLRDQFTAFVYSKYGFIPGIDLVRGIFELFKQGDVYKLWKAGGGEHATFVSLDRTDLQKTLKEAISDPTIKDTIVDVVKNPLKVLQILSEIGEMGTRLGEMRKALESGATPTEAAFAARNVTLDFSRIGTTTKGFNAIIAFLNANIQATDMMIRNFKNRPFEMLWKSLISLTLPSILLYLANRNDPRWKEIPQWQKNLFWIVLTKDHVWRIPKPFELGILFASIPERVMEVMDTKDPEAFNELEKSIMSGFTPGWMPTFMIPIVENQSNYSFFQDRPIVSPGKEVLPPPQQFGPYTTEVSKAIGQALNYSPAKIDNLIAGYGGGIGKYAATGIDAIMKGTGIVHAPPAPATKLEDTPVIKAFMIRPPTGTASESVNRVYTLYETTNQQMTYAKQLLKAGKKTEAVSYLKAHPDSVNSIPLSGAVSTFSDMNKAIDAIRQSSLDPKVKAQKIDQLQSLQTKVAEKTLEHIKNKKKL